MAEVWDGYAVVVGISPPTPKLFWFEGRRHYPVSIIVGTFYSFLKTMT